MITISKQYSFDAAHQLENSTYDSATNADVFGKCAALHGHTYTLEVELSGDVRSTTGMVLNYFDLDRIVKPIVEQLDHQFLNEVFDGMITTAENMVLEIGSWVNEAILSQAPGVWVRRVTLQETPKTKAVWHNG